MPSPFPGMDPYLESPEIFPDLHNSLIIQLQEAINAQLPPPFYATTGSRVWIEASQRHIEPDVDILRPRPNGNGSHKAGGGGVAVAEEIAPGAIRIQVPMEEVKELFLDIYAQPGNERLVSTIEVLSPSNKTPGARGRDLYLQKQREVLDSQVNLVEIDLLRAGVHSTAVPLEHLRQRVKEFDYHDCVHRFDCWDEFFVFPSLLRDRLPVIAVPLLPETGSIRVDLQLLLDHCYKAGLYDRRAHYREPLPLPLRPEQAAWAEQLLRAKGILG